MDCEDGLTYTELMTGRRDCSLFLRPMREEDLAITLFMRNDPLVRQYADSPTIVSENEHDAVFHYTDYPKYVCILPNSVIPESEEIVGFVDFRYDLITDEPNIKIWSFHIHPNFRGQKFSEPMLRLALNEAARLGYECICSYVQKDNIISRHLHTKLGFACIKDDDEVLVYKLNVR